MASLSPRERAALAVQRVATLLLTPLWAPFAVAALRFGMGWRLASTAELRAEYARLRREGTPFLVCANHLTLIDSALVAWALAAPWTFMRRPGALPWNVPDRANFASRRWQRVAIWWLRCLPIPRGGDRGEVAGVLARVAWLVERRDVVLVFPEGGRSRSGRVERETSTYGVGRVLAAVPGCRILCVHLRGEGQTTWSALPRRGERFRVSFAVIEPKSDASGLRRSVELTRQVIGQLADLEERVLDAR